MNCALLFAISFLVATLVVGSPVDSECMEERSRVRRCVELYPLDYTHLAPFHEFQLKKQSVTMINDCIGNVQCPRMKSAVEIDLLKFDLRYELSKIFSCLAEGRFETARMSCFGTLNHDCDSFNYISCLREELASEEQCSSEDLDFLANLGEQFTNVCQKKIQHRKLFGRRRYRLKI